MHRYVTAYQSYIIYAIIAGSGKLYEFIDLRFSNETGPVSFKNSKPPDFNQRALVIL
jgi:hypothetical protein